MVPESNRIPANRAAWVIVLTSSNKYVKGILAMAEALRRVRSRYPLLVLHTDAVTQPVLQLLKSSGCLLKQIDPVRPRGKASYFTPRFVETWTKLAVWNQDKEYDRLVLMDADMLPLQNMDELMTMQLETRDTIAACHACTCNPQKIKAYPANWIPANCAYTGWTDPLSPPPLSKRDYFNSGLIVLTPSGDLYQRIITRLYRVSDLTIYPFPDQDFLNEFFVGRWKPLTYAYNALKTLPTAHAPMWDFRHVKNIHYILSKPWDADMEHPEKEPQYHALYQVWWNCYKYIDDQEVESVLS